MSLHIVPIKIGKAREHVAAFHRHHSPPLSGLFALGCAHEETLVGVAVVGRPVSRHLDNGWTVEITRVCVEEDAPKGTCSKLIAACRKAAQALGYRRIYTYTLLEEGGASLRGAGMEDEGLTEDARAHWVTRPGRQTANAGRKVRWSAQLGGMPGFRPPVPPEKESPQITLL